MLGKRIVYAILLLLPVMGLVAADYAFNGGVPGIWLFPLGCLMAALAAQELHAMTRSLQASALVVVSATLLVSILSAAPLAWSVAGVPYPADCPVGRLGWTAIGTALAAALLFVDAMRRHVSATDLATPGERGEPASIGPAVVGIAAGLLVVVYIGVFYGFLVNLRLFRDNPSGMTALVSLIFVVKMSDIGAYALGRTFGRHKLAPRLSPGKTLEGALGGIVTACVAAMLYFAWIGPLFFPATRNMPAGPWWGWAAYGGILAGAGIVGDLSESLLKRETGQKDSSNWLPGLGGVLDIVDSLLFAAPAAYACWILGLVP